MKEQKAFSGQSFEIDAIYAIYKESSIPLN